VKPDPGESGGLISLLSGDGRPLLAATGLVLVLAGTFALFVAVRGEFLPHDIEFLGMSPPDLCAVNGCRIVHFMVHDRVSFGGALVAIGVVYLWLVAGPISMGKKYAWELLGASGVVGFASFLAYLGYGYLDTWHGAATGMLAPLFLAGILLTRTRVAWASEDTRWFARPHWLKSWRDRATVGRSMLLAAACGMFGGGLTITTVGMTSVFVPEDLAFMGMSRSEIQAVNPRLIPLIAHDRAGFGGAICCCGVLLAGIAWRAEMDRATQQALAAAGFAGFSTAIFVHPAIGYVDWWHLAPAVGGTILFAAGLAATKIGSPQRGMAVESSPIG
jgi:hypothetical protein